MCRSLTDRQTCLPSTDPSEHRHRTSGNHVPLDGTHLVAGGGVSFLDILTKGAWPRFNHEIHQINPNSKLPQSQEH